MIKLAPSNSVSSAAQSPEGLRDIKPPVEIPDAWMWVWIALAVVAVVALAYIMWRYWRNRGTHIAVPPLIPAHIRARRHLEDALALLSQPKPFCIAVSDTVRLYLEERFSFHAPERTTEEFLRELQGTDLLLPDQKESLGEFLKQCDLVKFARYEPGEQELRGLHESALRLVEETEPQPEPAQPEAANRKLETSAP